LESFENVKLIVQLANVMIKKRNSKAAEYGLTSGQALILRFLLKNRDKEEINQLDIESNMNLSHQTVTGMVRRLESKGYVACSQSSRDRRCKRIEPTPKAFEVSSALLAVAVSSEQAVTQDMTEAEQHEFNRLLHRAYRNMTGEEFQK
jgi:MarR family multiple gene transcriptional regulator MgrA